MSLSLVPLFSRTTSPQALIICFLVHFIISCSPLHIALICFCAFLVILFVFLSFILFVHFCTPILLFIPNIYHHAHYHSSHHHLSSFIIIIHHIIIIYCVSSPCPSSLLPLCPFPLLFCSSELLPHVVSNAQFLIRNCPLCHDRSGLRVISSLGILRFWPLISVFSDQPRTCDHFFLLSCVTSLS